MTSCPSASKRAAHHVRILAENKDLTHSAAPAHAAEPRTSSICQPNTPRLRCARSVGVSHLGRPGSPYVLRRTGLPLWIGAGGHLCRAPGKLNTCGMISLQTRAAQPRPAVASRMSSGSGSVCSQAGQFGQPSEIVAGGFVGAHHQSGREHNVGQVLAYLGQSCQSLHRINLAVLHIVQLQTASSPASGPVHVRRSSHVCGRRGWLLPCGATAPSVSRLRQFPYNGKHGHRAEAAADGAADKASKLLRRSRGSLGTESN